jgi:carboxymethylenebutenolidase
MIEEEKTVATPDGDMAVVICRPDGDGPYPVIVSFHHGPGLDAGSREAMAMIASWGYFVVSPDRYHRHGRILSFNLAEATDEERGRFFEIFSGTTDELVASDLDSLLAALPSFPGARSGAMGVIGYCIGARSALRAVAEYPDRFRAAVCLHPSFCVEEGEHSPHDAVPALPGSIYVGIGAEDQMQSAAMNKPLIDAVATLGDRGTAEVLEGANHGFAVPGAAFHRQAADRAYGHARAIFAAELG